MAMLGSSCSPCCQPPSPAQCRRLDNVLSFNVTIDGTVYLMEKDLSFAFPGIIDYRSTVPYAPLVGSIPSFQQTYYVRARARAAPGDPTAQLLSFTWQPVYITRPSGFQITYSVICTCSMTCRTNQSFMTAGIGVVAGPALGAEPGQVCGIVNEWEITVMGEDRPLTIEPTEVPNNACYAARAFMDDLFFAEIPAPLFDPPPATFSIQGVTSSYFDKGVIPFQFVQGQPINILSTFDGWDNPLP